MHHFIAWWELHKGWRVGFETRQAAKAVGFMCPVTLISLGALAEEAGEPSWSSMIKLLRAASQWKREPQIQIKLVRCEAEDWVIDKDQDCNLSVERRKLDYRSFFCLCTPLGDLELCPASPVRFLCLMTYSLPQLTKKHIAPTSELFRLLQHADNLYLLHICVVRSSQDLCRTSELRCRRN